MPQVSGQTILITGASSGLGRSLALALSRQDNNLVVTARRQARLESLAKEIEANGSRCTVVVADAVDPVACQAVVDAAMDAYGRIDVAVLNAGGGQPMSMAEAPAADVLRIMRINFDTLVNFLCPVIDKMRGQGGVIAYTGSPAGYFGLPKSGPYSAAKAAGRVLMDTCRIDLAETGIRCVSFYPGFTHTDSLNPDDVPVKGLIIDKDRAVREMLWALERRRSHHLFPKRIKLLIAFARLLPEPIRRFFLGMAA